MLRWKETITHWINCNAEYKKLIDYEIIDETCTNEQNKKLYDLYKKFFNNENYKSTCKSNNFINKTIEYFDMVKNEHKYKKIYKNSFMK